MHTNIQVYFVLKFVYHFCGKNSIIVGVNFSYVYGIFVIYRTRKCQGYKTNCKWKRFDIVWIY